MSLILLAVLLVLAAVGGGLADHYLVPWLVGEEKKVVGAVEGEVKKVEGEIKAKL